MAKIILIEDDEQLRALLAGCLGRAGHDVWHTHDAGVAMAELPRRTADIVITDLTVPNQDALEQLFVGDEESAPEIIAMSGSPHTPPYERMAQRLGGSRMLAKPFRTDTLIELVDRIVANRRYRGAWTALRGRTTAVEPRGETAG